MAIPKQLVPTFALTTPQQSNWKFCSSDGSDLSVSIPGTKFGVAITGGRLYVQESSSPSVRTLNFFGIGAGAGLQPIPVPGNLSISIKAFPCYGAVYMGPLASSKLSLSDFGGPCLIYEISAQVAPGYYGTVMFLGADWATALLPPGIRAQVIVARCRAIVAFHGLNGSIIPGSIGAFGALGLCVP